MRQQLFGARSVWLALSLAGTAGLQGCAQDGENEAAPLPGEAAGTAQDDVNAGQTEQPQAIASVTHAQGHVFEFFQSRTGGILVTERGSIGTPQVQLPKAENALGLFRAIAPDQAPPPRLIEADRNFQYAKKNGLLATPWLPPGAGNLQLAAIRQEAPLYLADDAPWLIDEQWFRDNFCQFPEGDRLFLCHTNKINSWTYRSDRLPPGRQITTAMVNHAGNVDVTWKECWHGIGCRYRISGPIKEGEYWVWRWGGDIQNIEYKIQPVSGGVWHFANTIRQ